MLQRLLLSGLVWLLAAGAASGQVPTVTSLAPALGKPGTQIIIGGGNFSSATKVQFDNAIADFSVLSASQILAIVPVTATVGKVEVVNASGSGFSAASFIVPPAITNIFPASGPVGTPVRIDGASFITNGTAVFFNGVAAASVSVTAPTQLQVIVPTGATSGFLTISNAAGSVVSSNVFVVNNSPVITSFAPLIGVVGTNVTIEGANFVSGATTVKFNGVPSASVIVIATTQLQAKVPTGATTGAISITTSGGTTSSATNFITGAQPLITAFYASATEFDTRSTIGAPGSAVTIEGFNFLGTTTVRFNSVAVAAGGITSVSENRLQVIVPAGATNGPISATTPSGTGTSTASFTTGAGPIVTDFGPVIGAVGQVVVINGINFSGVTSVKFNNTTVAVTPTAATQISVAVPAGAATGPLMVGTFVTSSNFTVVAAGPFISSFSPGGGPRGTKVVLTGANFTSLTAVRFNGVNAASFSAAAPNEVCAEVPPTATTGPITVTSAAGTATSGTFYVPPRLTSFTPANGVVGATVTLTGTNFTGTTSVTFVGTNGALVSAAITNVTANTLAILVPTNAATGPLTITTPGGVIISTTSFGLLPRVDSVTPELGPVGTQVTLTGLNFDTATAVRFNGVNAPVFSIQSATQFTATVPSGASTGLIGVVTAAGTGTSAGNFIVTMASDLAVTQTFSPAIILLGQPVTYTITVSNKGPSIVTGVVLADTLPPSVTLLSAIASQGSVSAAGGVVTATLGTLTNGTTATVFITFTPLARGINQNRATVSATEAELAAVDNTSETLVPVINDADRTLTLRPLPATSEVLLAWPLSVVTFQLQSTANLVNFGNAWVNVATGPVLVTNQSVVEYHVTNAAPTTRQFFRLKAP